MEYKKYYKGDRVKVKKTGLKGTISINAGEWVSVWYDKRTKRGKAYEIFHIKELTACYVVGEQLLFSFMEE